MALPMDAAFWAPIASIFDFTLRFEEIIFGLAFSTSLAITSLFLFRQYSQQPTVAHGGLLLGAKLATASVLILSQVATIIIWAVKISHRTSTSIPAASVELLASACLGGIIYLEHGRSIRSSAFVNIYLLLGLIFDGVKSRSFFLRPGMTVLGSMTAVVAGMRLILLILQEISKRTLLVDETQCRKLGIEATSGCISRTLFLFLQPVFATGFRTELLTRHLNELDPELSSEVLYEQLEPHWRPNQSNPSPHALLKPCLKAWKGCGVGLVFSRLVVTAFDFSRPFVLRRVIEMVDKPHGGPNNMKERLGVQGATACMFIGLALSRTTHAHLMNRYVTRVRGGLIGLMIHKEHRISEVEAKRSAAVTLMTADIDGIVTGIPQCLQIPIGLLEIALGTAVLSRFIGVSAFAVFAPLILTTAAAYAIAPWTAKRLARWNQGIQVRVAKTANILPHIATIKMLGLGPTVSTFLQSLREEEIAISKGYRLLQAISYGPILVGDLMTPVIVLAAALFGAALHGEMSAAKVFPILTVVSLIQQPLAIMLQTLSRWRNMLACFSRVQNFLCLAEKRDIRSRPLSADSSSSQSSGRAHGQGGVVRFRHAGIAPLGVKKLLLHNVHFDLPAGSITGLVGLTGSGKSTIVQTILGASEVLAGSVFVNTDEIGYCGENVWLRNSTIRENIIGDIEFNQARFTRVIRACFLEEDLSWLPGGADFVVGTNGSNLSGGQRQRVGIARTAYAEYPITIFDDAFSSLDHETAVVILHQLIGRNGIFRQAGCTVLVVTHLPTCLPLVNQLLVLEGPNCNILRTRAEIDEYGERLSCAMKTLNRNVPLAVEQREQRAVRTSLEGSAAATSEGPNVALRRKGDIRLYALFIRPIGWIRMILYTLFTSLFAAGEIIPEIYIRIWIETNPDKTTYFVGYASIGAATCVFGCLVYWFLFVLLSPRSSSQLHQRLVNTTMGATLRFLSTTKSGIFLNRYSQDMTLLSGKLPVALLRTIHAGTNVLAQIGIILAGATYLGGALPIVLLAIYFIQKFYLRTSRQVRHLELEAQDPLHTYFTETATGLTHIRAFKCQQQNIQRGISLLEAAQKPFYVQLAIQQWLNMVLGLLSGILGISLVAMALFIDESSSSSSIGLAFIGLIWLSIALEHLMTAWTDLETSTGALARLSIFEEQTPQEVLRKSESLPSHWPSTGRIELMNVTASHIPEDPGAVPALRDISLSILPGQHISIVGRSGSGKSSLFSTLLGFVYYEGRIKIDGVDIASISLNDLRSRLVTITQDQVQFDATIRTNLLPLTMNDVPRKSDGRSDEKTAKQDMDLEQLLKSLHIWLPLTEKGGLDAMLEDVGYSKGQVQLLCIARAILKQRETGSRVVLVDEATSSVDLQTERIVNQVVRENFAGCTVLTIAHRPTSIDGADGSICLHHGRLVDPDRGFSESEPEEDESGPEADESGEGAT